MNGLLETGSGEYWIAGQSGLYRFNPSVSEPSSPFTRYPLAGAGFNDLEADGSGGFWCSTERGVYHLERAGTGPPRKDAHRWDARFVELSAPSKKPEIVNADALLPDGKGALWIASHLGPYCLFPNGRTGHYSTRDGLPDNRVMSLLQDRQGTLWLGTWDGLCRISRSIRTWTTGSIRT